MDLPLETDCKTVARRRAEGAKFLLLDCRQQDEWNQVHIDGATLIPMGEIPARLEELADYRDEDVIVYCHHGGRSMRVTHWLREQGFPKAQSLAGGIDRWAVEVDSALPRY